ncbi:MAG: hypothetical protein KDG89_08290 [Geminicoccaceae bacterium]|nr:hypothetical protein [Geminicoccaceae bacterium]
MPPLERLSLLLALIQRLEDTLDRETSVIRQMRLKQLSELQAEKTALVEAYERELRQMRQRPDVLGALPIEAREVLEGAIRRLQGRIQANVGALGAARQVVEGVVRHLGESVVALSARGYGKAPAPAGHVIPVTFSQRI